MAVKKRPIGSETMSHTNVWDPESGAGLACSGLSEKASVAGTGGGRERVGCATREGSRARSRKALWATLKHWLLLRMKQGKQGDMEDSE